MVSAVKEKKILVFAHVPPPQHGQSVMVQALLDGLRSDPRFEVYHVDARVSDDLEDVGSFNPKKIARLLRYILQSWWVRLRHGPMTLYYVPAPAKLSAIARDWIVMFLCRPFFPRLVLHWHAYGLGEWATAQSGWTRKLTRSLLSRADLAIVLNDYNRADAEVFHPKNIRVVPNGIEDLFPDYSAGLEEARCHRFSVINKSASKDDSVVHQPDLVRFLFLGHLTETKGVLVAIQATVMANNQLQNTNAPWRAQLTLAGSFVSAEERQTVLAAVEEANRTSPSVAPQVVLAGFLDKEQKKSALQRADCLVFPTYYENEAQPLVLLEAMSSGLPVITTSWRGIASVLPEGSRSVVEPKSASALCAAIVGVPALVPGSPLRRAFEREFTLSVFATRVCEAIASSEDNAKS